MTISGEKKFSPLTVRVAEQTACPSSLVALQV